MFDCIIMMQLLDWLNETTLIGHQGDQMSFWKRRPKCSQTIFLSNWNQVVHKFGLLLYLKKHPK
jgi:hypothetical protein